LQQNCNIYKLKCTHLNQFPIKTKFIELRIIETCAVASNQWKFTISPSFLIASPYELARSFSNSRRSNSMALKHRHIDVHFCFLIQMHLLVLPWKPLSLVIGIDASRWFLADLHFQFEQDHNLNKWRTFEYTNQAN